MRFPMAGRTRVPRATSGPTRLRLSFADGPAFWREYEQNLKQGGLFLATDQPLELRTPVVVELDLSFRRETVYLQGEVVDRRPPEVATSDAPAGVAVQLLESVKALRAQLGPIAEAVAPPKPPAPPPPPVDPERRAAPRSAARVPARVESQEATLGARTRNVSRSGALLSLEGAPVPVGATVRLTLVHPTRGESLEVDGVVARHVESEGRVAGLAVRFAPGPGEDTRVERFVEELGAIEHARRLGGIVGPIEELGPERLVKMFGGSAPQGTLTLQRGDEEAVLRFEAGQLHSVRLGPVSGAKALARILAWREGRFEFHARLDAEAQDESLGPLEEAMLEAVRRRNALARLGPERIPATARLRLVRGGRGAPPGAGKTEEAVLDLATAAMPWWRILDVIPVGDAEILAVALALLDAGVLELAPA